MAFSMESLECELRCGRGGRVGGLELVFVFEFVFGVVFGFTLLAVGDSSSSPSKSSTLNSGEADLSSSREGMALAKALLPSGG
jgi:hypothetical protein